MFYNVVKSDLIHLGDNVKTYTEINKKKSNASHSIDNIFITFNETGKYIFMFQRVYIKFNNLCLT